MPLCIKSACADTYDGRYGYNAYDCSINNARNVCRECEDIITYVDYSIIYACQCGWPSTTLLVFYWR